MGSLIYTNKRSWGIPRLKTIKFILFSNKELKITKFHSAVKFEYNSLMNPAWELFRSANSSSSLEYWIATLSYMVGKSWTSIPVRYWNNLASNISEEPKTFSH